MAITLGKPPMESEFIEDSAIDLLDQDRFGHADFVQELADLVKEVDPRTNIAVFAPWGSGKSSLSAMLAKRYENREDGVWFTTFDAFKFAEDSLSRHFITQMANGFGLTNEEASIRSRLYSEKTRKIWTLTEADKKKLYRSFAKIAFAVLFAIVLLAAICDHFSKTKSFGDYLVPLLPSWAFVASATAIVVNFATTTFTYDETEQSVSGEEQFVEQFDLLIAKLQEKKAKKVVVFIDELDRCSEKEVVSTLETLKTFLDIEPCIFIVAADRQVLDKALKNAARQATPENVDSPYFSAGSAYLDKIFQHQMELPPLPEHSMSKFALELVAGRGGIWSELDQGELRYLFSVLIPTHVTNPRRVKVLLNSFVTTYHLMKRRASRVENGTQDDEAMLKDTSEVGEPALRDRLNEIAKLVCLRCEFPNFAAYLSNDDRLPDLVLSCEDHLELDYEVDENALRLAKRFVEKEIHVSDLLVSTDQARVPRHAEPEDGEGAAVADEVAEARQRERVSEVASSHYALLVNYLLKTKSIKGPRSDLVFLQSESRGLSISESDARALIAASRNKDVSAAVAVMARQAEGHQDGYEIFRRCISRHFMEIEGDNALLTLFGVMGDPGQSEPDEIHALALSESIEQYDGRIEKLLPEASGAGVLKLARATTRDDAYSHELRSRYSSKFAGEADAYAAIELVRDYAALPTSGDARSNARNAFSLWFGQSTSKGSESIELMFYDVGGTPYGGLRLSWLSLPDELAKELFVGAVGYWLKLSDESDEVADPGPGEYDQGITAAGVADALLKFARMNDRHQLAQLCIGGLHELGDRELLESALSTLPTPDEFEPSDGFCEDVIENLGSRDLTELSGWLPYVASAKDLTGRGEALARECAKLIVQLVDARTSDSFNTAAELLSVCASRASDYDAAALATSVRDAAREADDLTEFRGIIEVAQTFIRVGLAEPRATSTSLLQTATTRASFGPDAIARASEMVARENRESIPSGALLRANASLNNQASSLSGEELLRLRFVQMLCVGEAKSRETLEAPYFVAEDASGYFAQGGTYGDEIGAIWIREFAQTPEEIWEVLVGHLHAPLPPKTAAELGARAQDWSANERATFNRSAVDLVPGGEIDLSFFKASWLAASNRATIKARLIEVSPMPMSHDAFDNILRFVAEWNPGRSLALDEVVEKVALPAIKQEQPLADMFFHHVDSFGDVGQTIVGRLLVALEAHTSPHVQSQLNDKFVQLGWREKKRSSGIIGKLRGE